MTKKDDYATKEDIDRVAEVKVAAHERRITARESLPPRPKTRP